MADIRTEMLPYAGWRSRDAFFDDSVQRVLKTRLNPQDLPSGLYENGNRFEGLKLDSLSYLDSRLLLAWPIAVYDELNMLAIGREQAECPHFQWFYAQDQFFTVQLLKLLTDYAMLPPCEWPFDRALKSVENTIQDQNGLRDLRISLLKRTDLPKADVDTSLADWKTVAELIEVNFPQHRDRCQPVVNGVKGPYGNIRGAASRLRKKMNERVATWANNWAAYEELPTSVWDTPCCPGGFSIRSFFSDLIEPSPKPRQKRDA